MNTTSERPWTISTALLATLRSLVDDDSDTVHGRDDGTYQAYFRAVLADRTETIVLKISIEPRMIRNGREMVHDGYCLAVDSSTSLPTRSFSSYLEAYARASKFVATVLERGLAVEVPSAFA